MDDTDISEPRMERLRDPEGVKTEAWKQTLADMEAIADDRREDGWEVVSVVAAHTDTVSRDMGDDDEFGLVHVVPDNHAERFSDAFDDGFTEYLVYGTDVDGFMYTVTELLDPEAERSILIANRYDMARERGMVASARDEGALYTHVKTIDGTKLGTFEHEEFEPLVSRPSQ